MEGRSSSSSSSNQSEHGLLHTGSSPLAVPGRRLAACRPLLSSPLLSSLSCCFSSASSCPLMPQVRSGTQPLQLLAVHRLRQLADRLGLRQHPRPRPLPSASGVRLIISAGRGLRLSSALQLPGGRARRTDVGSRVHPAAAAAPGSGSGSRWGPRGVGLVPQSEETVGADFSSDWQMLGCCCRGCSVCQLWSLKEKLRFYFWLN